MSTLLTKLPFKSYAPPVEPILDAGQYYTKEEINELLIDTENMNVGQLEYMNPFCEDQHSNLQNSALGQIDTFKRACGYLGDQGFHGYDWGYNSNNCNIGIDADALRRIVEEAVKAQLHKDHDNEAAPVKIEKYKMKHK